MKINKVFIAIIVSVFSITSADAQTTFYNLDTIQKIELSFTQPDWDYEMDTAKIGSDSYIMAQWVKINGIQFDSVGVKYKGNSSYDSTYIKNPLHIALGTYKSQSYQGIKNIKLGNNYADPSMIREGLSYYILKNYMYCSRSNFAQLYINGVYIGLYANDEDIDKTFISAKFYSTTGTEVKCNPVVNLGPNTKSNLKYFSPDSSNYFNFYEIKSTYGWNDLLALADTVTNSPSGISAMLDMDRANWMLAFDNLLINFDSYAGAFCQNYYLYKDGTNRFNPIIWDLNMSFGGFPYVGSSNSSLGSLTISQEEQMTPEIHAADPYWPLINDVMNNATYKRMYIAHMRTILNEMFVSGLYQAEASSMQTVIDTAVASDVNNFFNYTQFQNGMNTNTVFGSYSIPGISNLMSARINYLQSTTDFTSTPPTITAITPNPSNPLINTAATITANVITTDTNAVYLGYRLALTDAFKRVRMYDDGLHNDGVAGDNIYGTSFIISSPQAQYYIYAENNNAGMFSPERAEHEFYTLTPSFPLPLNGQVVINEFLAKNTVSDTNEIGEYNDWIELYNTTSSTLSLYGLYITDNYSSPTKFAFPNNTVIQPNSFLMLWADNEPSTSSYLHCNFSLSASGEELMLSDGAGNVLDSITFGVQSADISMARCPDGTGQFLLLMPTFNASDCVVGIKENTPENNKISVYPNPANSTLTIQFNSSAKANIVQLFNSTGQEIFNKTTSDITVNFDTSQLPVGMYLVKINNNNTKKIQIIR